jgi:hypothetical protein
MSQKMIVDLREFAVVTLTAAPTGLKIVARFNREATLRAFST